MSQELVDSVNKLTGETVALLQEYTKGNTVLQNSASDAASSAAAAKTSELITVAQANLATQEAAKAKNEADKAAAVVTGGTATLNSSPGKIPLANSQGKIDPNWIDFANVSPANIAWDLFIPFNDSGKIERGFGKNDTIDVSVEQDGSTLVELPTKSVSFSRASARTVVNKSGEVETIAVDKLAIGRDGAEFYQTYANYQLNSEAPGSLSQSGWSVTKSGSASVPTIDNNFSVAPDGSQTASRVQFALNGGTTEQDHSNLLFIPVSLETGDTITGSLWIKSNTNLNYKMRFDFNGATSIRGTSDIEVTTEWKRFDITYAGIDGPWATRAPILRLRGTKNTADSADVLVWGAQVTKTSQPMPYVKTQSSAVTSSGDICTVTIKSNLPPAGAPFSIMCDIAFRLNERGEAWAVIPENLGGTSIAFLLRRDGPSNSVQFYFDDESGTDRQAAVSNVDENPHRFICTYDGVNTTKIYIDGELRGQNAAHGTKSYAGLGVIRFGGSGPWSLNNAVKNFGIIHRALSDDEIKALGAAK